MDVRVIDDFLPKEVFKELQDLIVYNYNFPFYFQKYVNRYEGNPGSCLDSEYWNWYAIHILFCDGKHSSISTHYQRIFDMFVPLLQDTGMYRMMMRMKVNMYPGTETLKEHYPHADYPFAHNAGLFSLNTCNGFTRLLDGTKIDSVENRMLLFDGATLHNSTTTTDAPARFNINFNFL